MLRYYRWLALTQCFHVVKQKPYYDKTTIRCVLKLHSIQEHIKAWHKETKLFPNMHFGYPAFDSQQNNEKNANIKSMICIHTLVHRRSLHYTTARFNPHWAIIFSLLHAYTAFLKFNTNVPRVREGNNIHTIPCKLRAAHKLVVYNISIMLYTVCQRTNFFKITAHHARNWPNHKLLAYWSWYELLAIFCRVIV